MNTLLALTFLTFGSTALPIDKGNSNEENASLKYPEKCSTASSISELQKLSKTTCRADHEDDWFLWVEFCSCALDSSFHCPTCPDESTTERSTKPPNQGQKEEAVGSFQPDDDDATEFVFSVNKRNSMPVVQPNLVPRPGQLIPHPVKKSGNYTHTPKNFIRFG